jgi:hemerythrin
VHVDQRYVEGNFDDNNKKMEELAIEELAQHEKLLERELVNAVKKCDLLRAAQLIDFGVSPNLQENGKSLLAIAIENEDELMVRMLNKLRMQFHAN